MKKLLLALLFLASPVFAQTQTQYYTVPTIAALKAMTTSRPAVVQVVDSNPGIFNLSTGACAAADDIFQVQPTGGTTVCYTRAATPYSVGKSATVNGVLVTSAGGVPSISTTLPAITAGAGLVTSTGSTTARSLAARFAEAKNVLDFGATGDGSTDDGAAIAAAITAAPAGGAVFFPKPTTCYKITGAIAVSKALTLYGNDLPKICQTGANVAGISVTASDVRVSSLFLQGPAGGSFMDGSRGVTATGTFNSGIAPTYITNLTVINSRFDGWDAYGVNVAYVDQVFINGNNITNTNYAAIATESAKNGRIEYNAIDTVGPGTSGDSYGIGLSRRSSDAGNLVSQPRTTDFTVIGNTIRNVPMWEGIDTHGGQNISIVGNSIYNVKKGIMIGSAANSAGSNVYGPINITVSNNVVESGVTNGTYEHGITFHGEAGAEKATGSVTGNTVLNYGDQTNIDNGGGIYLYRTAGVAVSGNSVVNAGGRAAIVVHSENTGLVISGNGIVDPWTNTPAVGRAAGIFFVGTDNTATISGNSCITNVKVATYLLSTATGVCVYVTNVSGNAVQLGTNYSTATTYTTESSIVGSPRISSVFPYITTTGQFTSTLSTGTAPFVVASTTNVANLNASSLNGATFAAPGTIGSGTPSSGAFTTVTASASIRTGGYTVATLPVAPGTGARAYVTDQLTVCAAVGAAPVGGGALTCPVFYNGTAWVGG